MRTLQERDHHLFSITLGFRCFNIFDKCTDAFRASFTWPESPVQVSGMSQSLMASRHVTPLSSYCQKKKKKTTEEDGQQREANKAEGRRVNRGLHKQRQTIQFKCWDALKQLTLQSLQQSPLLHMALWVRVHFLQQLAPLRAHSYGFIEHV